MNTSWGSQKKIDENSSHNNMKMEEDLSLKGESAQMNG